MIKIPSLSNIFKDKASENEPRELSSSRRHKRFKADPATLCTFQVNHKNLQILDISYGGIRLPFHKSIMQSEEITGNLCFLGHTHRITLKPVHNSPDNQSIGYCIIHKDDKTLVFMRRFLKDLAVGSSMVLIDPSLLDPSFKRSFNFCLRSPEPADIFIGFHNHKLENALITLTHGKEYTEIKYDGSILTTGVRISDRRGGAQIVTDPSTNPNTIKTAVLVTAGAIPQFNPLKNKDLLLALHQLIEKLTSTLKVLQKNNDSQPA